MDINSLVEMDMGSAIEWLIDNKDKFVLTSVDEKVYKSPSVAADIIILCDGNKIALIERKNPPYGWAIPGGFVDYGESLESAAAREALEETSLTISILGQLKTYSAPERDPRQPVISTVFLATAYGQTPKAADDAKNIKLFELNDLPKELAFDHATILDDFVYLVEHGLLELDCVDTDVR